MSRYALAAVAALIVASACAGGGGPVPTDPPSTSALATPLPSLAATAATAPPTAAPTRTASAPSPPVMAPSPTDVGPTVHPQETFPGAVALEALVPAHVGAITLERTTFSGQPYVDWAAGGVPGGAQQINDLVAGLGRSTDDISAARALGFADVGDDSVLIIATRVAGAAPGALLSAMLAATDRAPDVNEAISAVVTPVTIGGKDTTLVTTMFGDRVYSTEYYYGYGDVVFQVSGSDEDIVAEALSLLP